MKKHFIFRNFAFCVLLCALCVRLTSCSDKDNKNNLVFESFNATYTYSWTGSAADYRHENDRIMCDSASMVLPVILDGNSTAQLRDTILYRAFGQNAATAIEAFEKWSASDAKECGYETKPDTVMFNDADGFRIVQGHVVNLTVNLMTYCIVTSTYLPDAANGYETMDYINYYLPESRFIFLKDIFTPEGLEKLPELIAKQAENNSRYAGEVDITSLPENDNFYLSSEGEIVFSYQPMEVGPHSLGNVQVAFLPAELVNYMTAPAVKMFGLSDLVD